MKQNFYFKFVFLSLLMMVMGLGNAFAEDTWVKTDPADLKTDDVVVIADLTSSSAMSNDKGTSAAPTAKSITISSDKTQITSTVADNLQWTVSISEGGYQFFAKEKTWMYCIDNNNGLRVGTNDAYKLFSIKTVIINNENRDYLYNIAQRRYIGVYNGQDWRSYTTSPNNSQSNIKTTQIAFFKKESGDAVLSSISISGYTTTFNVGDTFVFGGTVMANYENGDPKDVTSFATISGYNMNTPGTQTVTVSYGGKTATYDITVNAVPVTGITLNTNEAEIEVGQTLQLTATIQPENATNKEYSWSSSDEDVATVDENGLVSAIAAGLAIITVTTTDGGKTAICAITVKAKEGAWYSLVTTTEDLAAGDKVIIVSAEYSKAMSSTQNTNNRGAVEVIIQNNKILVPNTGEIQIFTLKGNVTDGWYFYTGNGYIYAASSSNNYLRTEEEKDDNAKAIISFSGHDATIEFQGSNTRNLLKYNNTNTLFSCYSSGQKNVQIYRRVNENDVEVTISAVGYSTLYYGDRALTVPEGVTATTYSVTDGKLTESKKYDAGMTIPKGEAVVLKGAAGKYRFAAASTAEEVDVNNKLKGSDNAEETTGGTLYYALTLNKQNDPKSVGFYWMNETGTAFTNGAHKAYLALDGSLGGGAQAKSSYLFSEVTTGINGAENVAHDAIQEGYNLNGQRVSQGYRGIVIVNGRKYIAK